MIYSISSQDETFTHSILEIKSSMTSNNKITSHTHNFYKYPACFPETFPRTVLKAFSKENSLVLDPFSGGGTTAVECLTSNRDFVGLDINELAVFVGKLKTTYLDLSDLKDLDKWVEKLDLKSSKALYRPEDQKYFSNVTINNETFVRKMKWQLEKLMRPNAKLFATGALLRLMQLELERTDPLLSPKPIIHRYIDLLEQFVEINLKYRAKTETTSLSFQPSINLFASDVSCTSTQKILAEYHEKFDLVITSPPYPQRHILYNKWQVKGRSETRLPYWIIDSEQFMSESDFTMGARENKACLEIYLSTIFSCYENLNPFIKKNALVFQVVAFSDIKEQLFGFLDAMEAAGFEEVKNIDNSSYDGRLWRKVPHQRWYNRIKGQKGGCKEVVLVHRKTKSK